LYNLDYLGLKMPITWLASHQEGPHSVTGQSMWDLWWTGGHWDIYTRLQASS